ncbi:signal peptidase I [Haloarculaceae archaeon H-GB11]|nr:signal peptidase I [Haloarculaceae archaeon H-GB11]
MNWGPIRSVANALGVAVLLVALVLTVVVAVPSAIGAESSYVVLSDSMSPSIEAGDVVVIRDVPTESLQEGDVITFESSREGGPNRVTHRIVDVMDGDDGLTFRTKGDANEEADRSLVTPSQIEGKLWFHVPAVGRAVLFAGTDLGLVLFVIVPSVLLVVSELYSLYSDATSDSGGGTDYDDLDCTSAGRRSRRSRWRRSPRRRCHLLAVLRCTRGTASATAAEQFGPIAEAGGPYEMNEGTTLYQLDGTGSSNDAKSYSWQIISGPGKMASDAGAEPYYDPPDDVASDTTATVELTVTDAQGISASDTATITIRNVVNRPTVNYLFAFTSWFGGGIDFYTNVEDPTSDGDQLDRIHVTVVDTGNGNTAFENTYSATGDSETIWKSTGNLGNGEYRVTVTVYDQSGNTDSRSDTVTISGNALATSSGTVSHVLWQPADGLAGGDEDSARDGFGLETTTNTHEITRLARNKAGTPTIDGKLVGEAGNDTQQFIVLAGVSDPKTDQDDLSQVEVAVVNTTSGATAYHTQRSVSGQRAKVNTTTTQLTSGQEYRIDITATDADGDAVTDSITKTMP